MENTRKVEIYGDLDKVVRELLKYKEAGEDVYCMFNGHALRSKDITWDSAYLEVTGFTKEEYERKVREAQRKWEEKEKKETEEAIKKIPEWIERGKRIIAPELHDKWRECVGIRAKDLYHGHDLDDALVLMEMLHDGATMDQVLSELERQKHSGSSYAMVTSMIFTFSEKRNQFFRATTKLPEVKPINTIDETVEYLISLRNKGERVFCDFNGHILLSENVTMESAYLEVMGCTKEEWEEKKKKWHEEYEREEKETKEREAGYKKMVEEQRKEDGHIITKEKVIAGLKYIAEHRHLDHTELVQGLIDLGCTFTLDDVKKQFPEDILLFEGMAKGDLGCGASVICNVRDSEYGRSFADDKFLGYDDEPSIYNFIRIVTGDPSYTMESVSQGAPKL